MNVITTETITALEMLVIHADCQRAFSRSRIRVSWSAIISRRASITAKRFEMSASSDGVVARGESSGITLRLGLLQQACLLGLALVLLVMAMVRCQRFPLVFLW